MGTYILRRLLLVPVTLFILSFGTAMVIRLTPGDVVDYRLQNSYTPERADALREQLGLNKGPFEAYFSWMSNAFQGDFGSSFVSSKPVVDEVKRRFPVTIELVVLTVLVQAFVAIPLGAIAAVRQNGLSDHSIRIMSVLVLAVPSFVVAVFALKFPPIWWGWLPPLGYVPFQEDPLRNMQVYSIPVIVGALGLMATLIRLTRTEMLEVLRQDYVRTARSKGLQQVTVVRRHALRNALIPVITVLGLSFGGALGGVVIIEQIFSLPGLGLYALNAVQQQDYLVVQTFVVFSGFMFVMVNLVVDLVYAWLNPRIRYS
ncbi:MAG: ABC transporter permease [Dehalococcoidia bacterium]|nr:ABC transporter permease [Chloroflexota bacterium]MXX18500.1 ABC transporter permease [Dehalococcoidia bacterium]MYD27723.1 ABC transporter permease [Dehalococcoidia bacterium]